LKSKHFKGKIFINCSRFVKFAKNFPLENNPLYGILKLLNECVVCVHVCKCCVHLCVCVHVLSVCTASACHGVPLHSKLNFNHSFLVTFSHACTLIFWMHAHVCTCVQQIQKYRPYFIRNSFTGL